MTMTTACACIAAAVILLAGLSGLAQGAEGSRSGPASNPSGDRGEYARMSGRALVENLTNAQYRSRAFYELWKRDLPGEAVDYESFLQGHYDPETIVCPQGNGAPPLYLVLYGFLGTDSLLWNNGYEITNPAELFPRSYSPAGTPLYGVRAIVAYTSDGICTNPYGSSRGNTRRQSE